jgi:hypothetical protein
LTSVSLQGTHASKVASKVRGSSEPAPKVSPIDTCSNSERSAVSYRIERILLLIINVSSY